MTTTPQTTTVFTHSLPSLVEEVVRLTKDGWELDPNFPADTFGFSYHVGMIRSATPEQLAKDAKPSRAEILANARAAKAEKKRETSNGE